MASSVPFPHTEAEIHRRALFAVEAESVGGRPAGCFDDVVPTDQMPRSGGVSVPPLTLTL